MNGFTGLNPRVSVYIFLTIALLLSLATGSAAAVNATPHQDNINTTLNASYNFTWANISIDNATYFNGSLNGSFAAEVSDVFIRGVIGGNSDTPYQPSYAAGIIFLVFILGGLVMAGAPKDVGFVIGGGMTVMFSRYVLPEWAGLLLMMVIGISLGILMLRLNRGR